METNIFCHLPKPYPDELLYSVIARYLVHTGGISGQSFHKQYLGLNDHARVTLPSNLDLISNMTWPTWRMTGDDIANNLTLFPYYTRYMPTNTIRSQLEIIKSSAPGRLRTNLGENSSLAKTPRYLRFCNLCKESDMGLYGETYWRRTHQISGVLVCTEHNAILIETNAPRQSNDKYRYFDATEFTSGNDIKLKSIDLKNDHDKAFQISKRCKQLLIGNFKRWSSKDIYKSYLIASHDRGYSKQYCLMSGHRLIGDFCNFFGKDLLLKLGFDLNNIHTYNWILNMFTSIFVHFDCLNHALIQLLLESLTTNGPFSGNSPDRQPAREVPWVPEGPNCLR